ncbi:YciI family protein [Actinoplanes sp. NEAU-A12]|uniref:YciI family protein n=1 Tax=Actinoplanes sandaracinus TaxID=3045177 RepID=A0ABT6WI95_9ACTN|nr:YciI family protein [Actinoplanes sandaracinus]MDI6099458.1 YciI family protein [Actinoplanes sandaracinus]
MFVVVLTYRADLARVDEALQDHIAWLDRQYADGVFIASGRRVPRVGGVILAGGLSAEDLERRLAEDPFRRLGLAEYAVTEFVASRAAAGFERLLS